MGVVKKYSVHRNHAFEMRLENCFRKIAAKHYVKLIKYRLWNYKAKLAKNKGKKEK